MQRCVNKPRFFFLLSTSDLQSDRMVSILTVRNCSVVIVSVRARAHAHTHTQIHTHTHTCLITQFVEEKTFLQSEFSYTVCIAARHQSYQSIFYFMSVHIEVILDKNKKHSHIIIIYTNFPTENVCLVWQSIVNNRFCNISNNISIIQNISYSVVSI